MEVKVCHQDDSGSTKDKMWKFVLGKKFQAFKFTGTKRHVLVEELKSVQEFIKEYVRPERQQEFFMGVPA
jgi:hypothetical protein